jgi:hypothetical protein
MTQDSDAIDWSATTWAGARREQVRQWLKLTVRERLQAVEAMGRVADALHPRAPPRVVPMTRAGRHRPRHGRLQNAERIRLTAVTPGSSMRGAQVAGHRLQSVLA